MANIEKHGKTWENTKKHGKTWKNTEKLFLLNNTFETFCNV